MPSVLQPNPMRHDETCILMNLSFIPWVHWMCLLFSPATTQMVQHIYLERIQDIFAWQYYVCGNKSFPVHFIRQCINGISISFSTSTSYAPILTVSLWLQHLYLSSDISKYMCLVIQSCCGRPSERWTKWWSFISSQPIYWPFANGIEHSGRVISISSSTLPIYCCICTSHLACLCPWKCFTETIH